MKHLLLTLVLAVCSIAASAQVPKFFGVPVDGSPDNFVAKLKRAGKTLELEGDNGSSRTYSFADNENASLVIEYQKNLIYCITMTMYEDSEEHQDITAAILLARSKKDNGSEGYKRHTYIGSDKVSIRKETPQGDIYITPKSPDASNYWTYAVVYKIWNVTNSKKLSE